VSAFRGTNTTLYFFFFPLRNFFFFPPPNTALMDRRRWIMGVGTREKRGFFFRGSLSTGLGRTDSNVPPPPTSLFFVFSSFTSLLFCPEGPLSFFFFAILPPFAGSVFPDGITVSENDAFTLLPFFPRLPSMVKSCTQAFQDMSLFFLLFFPPDVMRFPPFSLRQIKRKLGLFEIVRRFLRRG